MKTLDHTVLTTSGRAAASASETPAGHGQHLPGGHADQLGVATSRQQRAHLVADRPAVDAVTDRVHRAADLEAGVVRRARRRRVEAHPLHDVGAVDPGRRHPDPDLAGSRLRVGDVGQHERRSVAGLAGW